MRSTELAERLAGWSRTLEAEDAPAAVWKVAVEAALLQVPGAQYAGVTALEGPEPSTPVCSHDLAARVEELQYAGGEGPCLEAADGRTAVHSGDLDREARWVRFSPAATAMGVRSVLSVPLYVRSRSLGALNLYAADTGAFGPQAAAVGTALATHTALALHAVHTEEQLRTALGSRDVIGQAMGILMERHKVTSAEAFDRLVEVSQTSNTKLRVVAERLVTVGRLEDPASAADPS